MGDQWARQALNGASRAHWDAEQDGINRNSSDQIVTASLTGPPVYTSEMAEETCGVTDKVAPSQRSTK